MPKNRFSGKTGAVFSAARKKFDFFTRISPRVIESLNFMDGVPYPVEDSLYYSYFELGNEKHRIMRKKAKDEENIRDVLDSSRQITFAKITDISDACKTSMDSVDLYS